MRTSFHHQPEAQHQKSSAIHKLPADYPIFRRIAVIGRFSRELARTRLTRSRFCLPEIGRSLGQPFYFRGANT
jgi:hypothetical protein